MLDGLAPRGRPPLGVVRRVERVERGALFLRHVEGQLALVGAHRAQVGERAGGRVAHGHGRTGGAVALTAQFQVEPHDELLRLLVVYHFGAFHDATLGNVARRVVFHHGEDGPFVFPVGQVVRRVAHDAHQRVAGAVGLVFSVPIIFPVMVEHSAAVRVDVRALVIGPDFARADGCVVHRFRAASCKQASQA